MLCTIHFSAFLAFILCFASVTAGASSERTKTVDFNVKPGGVVHTFTEGIGKYECSFTYAAQGGTNEQWLMSVGLSDDDKLFSCSIWRPQGTSYLFFQQFKAELKGTKIHYANAYTGHGDVELKPGEITKGDSAVTHTEGKFNAQLSKLVVIGKTTHDEL